MVRIIDRRDDARPGENVAKLRVWKLGKRDVRACLLPLDAIIDQEAMLEISDPAAEAFLDAIAQCEKEGIAALWVHDPLGLFPPRDRPMREKGRASS
jgi:hypothetical protein